MLSAWAMDFCAVGADAQRTGTEAHTKAITKLDLQNAYGAMLRSAVLADVQEYCPQAAKLLLNHWGNGCSAG